jgi:hypothetical protein
MVKSLETVKEFRNSLLMVYYAEGQDLNSNDRKLIENILSLADKLIRR